MKKESRTAKAFTGVLAAVAIAAAAAGAGGKGAENRSSKTSEAAVVTNDNGSVTRTFVECNVKTNGNMVTEHRRETRTTLDTEGNVLENSTSEYSQSYTVGGEPAFSISSKFRAPGAASAAEADADSFLGLKFGETWSGSTNWIEQAKDATMLAVEFEPAKKLDGFDKYIAFLTPKTRKIAKVYACAKEAVDPGARWHRHYIVEALEKKYGAWPRLCSYMRPAYRFDLAGGRHVLACLADASSEWQTVLSAWDDKLVALAEDESESARIEARKAAKEVRQKRVDAAADAF